MTMLPQHEEPKYSGNTSSLVQMLNPKDNKKDLRTRFKRTSFSY